MITETQTAIETVEIQKAIDIAAPIEIAFAAMLDELGPDAQMMDGTAMPFKLEAWPGGRWYRDLGDNNGHFWATVQAIKRPTLLELTGPLFMSAPVVNNLQYRLSEKDGGTLITFRHTALGFVSDEHKAGMTQGWAHIFERVRQQSEVLRSGRGAGK